MKSTKFKSLKTTLLLAFLALLVISVGMLAVACHCQHNYEAKVTKDATCVEEGEITYTCNKCGDSFTERTSVLNEHNLISTFMFDDDCHWLKCEDCGLKTKEAPHNYATIVFSEQSTCSKQGRIVTECICGQTHIEFLPLTEHDFSDYEKQGDYHWQKCQNCDFVTEKIKHEFTTQGSIIQSTCTIQGSSVKLCICGEIYSESLPLANHVFSGYQKEGDYHWQKCQNCNFVTDKVNHKFTVQGSIIPSTCVVQGSSVTSCVCGQTFVEDLPYAEHTYNKIVYDSDNHWFVCNVCEYERPNQTRVPHSLSQEVNAECGQSGKIVTTCSGCEYSQTIILDVVEHDLDKTQISSTDNEHYYKCKRCGQDIAEAHEFDNCDCPDELNCAATCYKEGHQDQICNICGLQRHVTVSKTGEHRFSAEWSSDDNYHWHACLNGDGVCNAKDCELQHSWQEIVSAPTCTEDGSGYYKCSCGKTKGSHNTYPTKLGHDYATVEIITPSTCVREGLEKKRCSRCNDESEFAIARLEHDMSKYDATNEGHYVKCVNCDFALVELFDHIWIDRVDKVATCTQNGLTIRTCKYCKYEYEQVTVLNHKYVTDNDSNKAATCKEYATHSGTCVYCGDTKTFVDEYLGYAPHNLKEFLAVDMTETEAGNIHYWQCLVCSRYFADESCEQELTEDEVFIYPTELDVTVSIDELYEIAESLQSDTSDKRYQVEAIVEVVDEEKHQLTVADNNRSVIVSLTVRENLDTINVNDRIVIKGKISKSDSAINLIDCAIISVSSSESNKCSLFITVSGEYSSEEYVMFYADTDSGAYYFANTNNYNCLSLESSLTFWFIKQNPDVVLQKAIINGQSVTVNDMMLTVTVTEDIYAEFVFAQDNDCSVAISNFTVNASEENTIMADEYVSYAYVDGGYNESEYVAKNSLLRITVTNACITEITIKYDSYWLTNNPSVLDNTVNAVKSDDEKVPVSQGEANDDSQIVIILYPSESYIAFEYLTDVSSAFILEMTITYQTYNNL